MLLPLCIALSLVAAPKASAPKASAHKASARKASARKASANQALANEASANLASVRELFEALEARDVPRLLRIWADDGVQEMPYAPEALPRLLTGKAAIEEHYAPLPTTFKSITFPLRRLLTTDQRGVVVAEFDGSIELASGGRYDNRYVGVFQFNSAGKLAHYTEYFGPMTPENGFPGADEMAMSDTERIRHSVWKVAETSDARDWAGCRALFADSVDVDYTSVTGGSPTTVKADDLVAGWAKGLGAYASTKHNFSEAAVKIDGTSATATFTGQATHLKADESRWSCGGDYVFRFSKTSDGWRISGAQFVMKWEQGTR